MQQYCVYISKNLLPGRCGYSYFKANTPPWEEPREIENGGMQEIGLLS
ncbi:hypothetical protein LZF95_15020 [Algoriphagus sp. AGSA1]|nr:hypothetical protein [Algoriphagus sp. AGSA1]MCE7055991.1 hypothetical protein [Algoriphagus sp. AGSA1]